MRRVFIPLLMLMWTSSLAQINVALLHQLVDNNRSEYSRQTELRGKQAISTATEEINRSQASQLKTTYRNIQKKFSAAGMVIEGVQIGMEAIPLVDKISGDQQRLMQLLRDSPGLSLLAIESEIDFADRSQMLLRYLYGLILSAGELSAMSRSDRQMLSSFVISELHSISLNLSGLVNALLAAKRNIKPAGKLFSDAGKRDKQLASTILSRLKQINK
ncbi:hypothetical protein [Pedobacter agri]|uniref:hypothetical protein n=1 Tax=Pedobacter agri TaxID=454586 RepID=UPI00292CEE74|nr:hypothetical protein [Pedobacter agri]